MDIYTNLLLDVHHGLQPPTTTGQSHLTKGSFRYYHYNCDSFQDQGWGCAYRTLQSMASWVIDNKGLSSVPPSLPDIQKTLVNIVGDKPQQFIGSRDWIGAMEVFYVLDGLYDVPCKILHVSNGSELKQHTQELQRFFDTYGGLIMMGGDVDSSSKGIAGIHVDGDMVYYLIVDPHYLTTTGKAPTRERLHEKGYIRWQPVSQFVEISFYNLCLPMVRATQLEPRAISNEL